MPSHSSLRIFLAAVAIVTMIATPLLSHHYILVPEKYIYNRGDSVKVHLMVGEPFAFEFERDLQRDMTPHFMFYTSADSMNLMRAMRDSSRPILTMVADFSGLGLVEMQRSASTIEEKPGAFQRYLAEEKINDITFDSSKWKKEIVKEKYSRCIKSLITCGAAPEGNIYSKKTGQKLELLLLNNPYSLSTNERIGVKLLWNGQPLAGQWIAASVRNGAGEVSEVSAKTGADGTTSFEAVPNGTCYLHTVKMVRLSKGDDMDFESVWASFSFQMMVK
jgi:hypothetical protein